MKVVIDANVIVSGLSGSVAAPRTLLARWSADDFEVISSHVLIDELMDVLHRPRVRRFLREPPEVLELFIATFRNRLTMVEPQRAIIASRDPDDDRVLEAAVAGDAQYIVTGDADFLALGSFEGITILTPAAFLGVIGPADVLP